MAGAWTRVALAAGRADGVDTSAWIKAAVEAGARPAALGDGRSWIPWPVMERFLGAIGEDYRSPLEWFHLGRLMNVVPAGWPGLGAWVSPGRLLEWSVRRLADAFVRPLVAEVRCRDGSGGVARVSLSLGDPCAGGERFFWITAGQCAVVPVALGQPEALVEAEITSREGVFDLRLPPSRTMAARVARMCGTLARAGRAAEELGLREFEVLRARSELASLREEFDRLLDHAPHGIVVHDRGEILHANPAFAEIVGVPPERARDLSGERLERRLAFADAADWRRFLDPGIALRAREEGRGFVLRGRVRGLDGDDSGREIQFRMIGARPMRFGGRLARLVAFQDLGRWREMERQVLQAGDLERRRIALDLHDVLGQTLAAVSFQVQLLERRTREGPEPLRAPVAALAPLARDAMRTTRALARGLDPVGHWEGGLARALEILAQSTGETFGLAVAVDVDDDLPDVPDAVSLQLYRIAQEALGNVARHAEARRARILVQAPPDDGGPGDTAVGPAIRLVVEDDGVGITDPGGREGARDSANGFGLQTMRYRAEAVGGWLVVGPRSDGPGTRVEAVVPASSRAVGDQGATGTGTLASAQDS